MRLKMLERVMECRYRQAAAGRNLGISARQVTGALSVKCLLEEPPIRCQKTGAVQCLNAGCAPEFSGRIRDPHLSRL